VLAATFWLMKGRESMALGKNENGINRLLLNSPLRKKAAFINQKRNLKTLKYRIYQETASSCVKTPRLKGRVYRELSIQN